MLFFFSYVFQPSLLRAVVGTAYRLSGGSTYDVQQIIPHESYNSETLEHDIAIIVTKSIIVFSDSVKAVSVASPNMILPDGYEAIVSGFGHTSVSLTFLHYL